MFPACVFPSSSPAAIIGTPWDSSSVERRFRIWRSRSVSTVASSVCPSTPQFQEWLSSAPSRFSSPLASLCLCSYETRSRSVNPSCAVTKFTDAKIFRPAAS